ncbi:MAG: amidohydrolase family protein [Rhodobiaceae bacterium]|nr:amidohydrolase family protein [Rhodobiaceae bacterium]MCC0054576.1 amidohydrolase family protein [Rhodobiaceae bacterium]
MSIEEKPVRGAPPHHYIDDEWLALREEEVLEPSIPIIDPHHHLWHRPPHQIYLLPHILEDVTASGHHIRGTCFVECTSMYRADGDPRFACLGQVEFVNGIAAMSASGTYGPIRIAAGIIGKVDLREGASAREVLEACIERAPERFRGIRHMAAWDESKEVSSLVNPPPPHLLMDRGFREGFAQLAPLGLTFDAWCYHPQLPELIDLVDAFPDTSIIVNHMGGRAGIGPYAGHQDDVFRQWSRDIRALGERSNVTMKFGGIGMRLAGFDFLDRDLPPTSQELSNAFRPYFDVCLEAFGPARTMFESNFPVDKSGCSYRVMWNTFKRLAANFSAAEKADLFAGTAARIYRLPEELTKPAPAK